MDLRNKKITVVGLGNSGFESAMLLEEEGAIVAVTDSSNSETVTKNAEILKRKFIDLELGKHTESFLESTDMLVLSPGVESSSLPVRYAEANCIPVISELELGSCLCKGEIIAVTGTNGKSTVVSMLGEILREAKIPVNVCGNIGNSLSGEVLKIKEKTKVVLEVSSFQLERTVFFKPKISVMLNIAEDHLDRYKDMAEYVEAKKKIFKNQKKPDIAILNYDDEGVKRLLKSGKPESTVLFFSRLKKVEGVFLDNDIVKTNFDGETKTLFKLGSSKLEGNHNIENILAVSLVATLLGADKKAIEKVVKKFNPLNHRFAKIAEIKGVKFIDDSKATNVDSTKRAIESISNPVVLIAGGKDKNLVYDKILPAIKKRVKKMVLIGETRPKMKAIFEKIVPLDKSDTMEEAVCAAYKSARPGDTVLLSPMCSSFDMFKDYKERGDAFRKAVTRLK